MYSSLFNATILPVLYLQMTNKTVPKIHHARTVRTAVRFLPTLLSLVAHQAFLPLERLAAGTTRIDDS